MSVDNRVNWLVGPQFHPTPLAGDKVVVVDTSEPDATPSDPDLATTMNQQFSDYLAGNTEDSGSK
jgi:phosphoribulokinase